MCGSCAAHSRRPCGRTSGLTVNVTPLNHAPTTSGGSVVMKPNTVKTFAAGDFPFSDVDAGNTLGAIKVVTTLPVHGSVMLGGTTIISVPSAAIPVASIGTLTYTPAADYIGADSFKFQVRDAAAYSADGRPTLADWSPSRAGCGAVLGGFFMLIFCWISPLPAGQALRHRGAVSRKIRWPVFLTQPPRSAGGAWPGYLSAQTRKAAIPAARQRRRNRTRESASNTSASTRRALFSESSQPFHAVPFPLRSRIQVAILPSGDMQRRCASSSDTE